MVMYEVHMPVIILAKISLDKNGEVYKVTAKREFKKAILYLKMALEMLKFAPRGSIENQLYLEAKDSVSKLEAFEASL